MTIVVSVKVTDGIVLASDSATTFADHNGIAIKVYNNANKIFNLVKGLPLGAMTFGTGSIGVASIATHSKDLRTHFGNQDSPYYFDPQTYTVEHVAEQCRRYFTDQMDIAYPNRAENFMMGYRVCGYGASDDVSEGWEIFVTGDGVTEPKRFYDPTHFGPRWNGDTEALDRLVLGMSESAMDALIEEGLNPENRDRVQGLIHAKTYRQLHLPAMPIQDAIELARFLAETAAKFSHFSLLAPTIGGPIEIATITKHEGFKWVARKHFFPSSLNSGAAHD